MITKTLQHKVLVWLAASAPAPCTLTLALWLTFSIKTDGARHPRDPDDLVDCLVFLKAVPELRAYLPRLKGLSGAWGRLAAEWSTIEATFHDELGLDWSISKAAPKTGALLARATMLPAPATAALPAASAEARKLLDVAINGAGARRADILTPKITSYTLAEWNEEGYRRFGPDQSAWRFVCPSCGYVASIADWKAVKAPAAAFGFACIGRFTGSGKQLGDATGGPCNYTTDGAFNISPVRVIDDGESRSAFDFAPADAAA